MIWFFLVTFVVIAVVVAMSAEKAKRQAKEAYEASLQKLKSDPSNSDLRQRTLALGRAYSSLMRDKKGQTVFDEVALMNDINAACAGALQITQARAPSSAADGESIESRLRKLQALRETGLIDDDDFARRKREIMDLI